MYLLDVALRAKRVWYNIFWYTIRSVALATDPFFPDLRANMAFKMPFSVSETIQVHI